MRREILLEVVAIRRSKYGIKQRTITEDLYALSFPLGMEIVTSVDSFIKLGKTTGRPSHA